MSQISGLSTIALTNLAPISIKKSISNFNTVTRSNLSLTDNISISSSPRVIGIESVNSNNSNNNRPLLFDDYPDGGLAAWLVVLGSFFGLIVNFGLTNSLGALEAYIAKHQLKSVDTSTVGWVFSIHLMVTLNGSILSGELFDKNGPRLPLIIGTILTTTGLILTGNSETIYQFILSFGVVTALGVAIGIAPLIGIISHYFDKRRGMATSFASIGGSVGGCIFPIILRTLYTKVGFIWAMRIFALICCTCYLIALALLKPRISHNELKQIYRKNPVDNNLSKSTRKLISFWNYLKGSFDFRSAITDHRFMACVMGILFAESGLTTASTYFASYTIHQGINENTAYFLITLVNLTGIGGRLVCGLLSDKLGKFNIMIIMVFLAGVFCLVIWLPFGNKLNGLYCFASFYGFSSASVLSLTPVCVGQISRVEEFGKRYSTMYFFVSFAQLAAIPLGGLIIGKGSKSQYDWFVVFISLLMLCGSLFFILTRYFTVKLKFCRF
ncbi:MCT family MFS transporter [Ascoidea rubescens DSM 1968]|uniref:Monocarboxylate permease n=1 Tax=Ascoidea rubescens DSM 1968 TaxID=1344418 RepID=A0A1D2VJN2_9ASCO|nr:monocarboxylate permease [Ascoidea rubescens DSM 1968]ODV61826.1 monocarboxylate permease [Ascoidea rubescens DSM 1968]